jgi:hypothetical protein
MVLIVHPIDIRQEGFGWLGPSANGRKDHDFHCVASRAFRNFVGYADFPRALSLSAA